MIGKLLGHADVLEQQAVQIRATRHDLMASLQQMSGVCVFNSNANFVLVELLNHDASEVFEALKTRGILVKNMTHAHPLLRNCLRLTVGSVEENLSLIEAMRAVVSTI